jgi:hypothetical protein
MNDGLEIVWNKAIITYFLGRIPLFALSTQENHDSQYSS